MKKINKVLKVVIFFITLFLCMKIMDFVLVNNGSRFPRFMMEDMYNYQDNIDILFLGTSHTERSIDTELLDSLTGKNTFNAGTSSQALDGSYALLKEASKTNKLEEVYLELYFDSYIDNFKDRKDLTETYIISDYMKPSINKYSFMFNAGNISNLVNTFFPARRNWKGLTNIQHLKDAIGNKIYPFRGNELNIYKTNGYVKENRICDINDLWIQKGHGTIKQEAINFVETDAYCYLRKIKNFCDENNIKLTVLAYPIQERMVIAKEKYDMYYESINNVLKDLNIDYYDFNLCSNAYFDATNLSLFSDDHHLNYRGAEALDSLYAKIINKENIKSYFNNSFKEKLDEEQPTVYGLAGPKIEDDLCKTYIVSNRDEGMEYYIEVTSSLGDTVYKQEFNTNRYFSFPENGKYNITIKWRLSNSPQNVHTIETTHE